MALRHLAPRFVDWRLSRIDEEVDRVSCSSDATTPPSPPLPPPPPLLLDDDPAASDTSAAQDDSSTDEAPPEPPDLSTVIYSNADEWRKQQLERSAAEDEREALRFIKEKYDSLGKVAIDKPTAAAQGPAASPTAQQSTLAADQMVYENVPRTCAKAIVAAEGRRQAAAECAECRCQEAASNSALCCGARQPAAVQRRELRQQHPPCQRHHHHHHEQQQQQQEEEEERQRQRLTGDCIPRSALSDGELMQIDLFYRSYKSSVYACTCLATLSFSRPVLTASAKSKSTPRPPPDDHDDGVWACVRTGIPVIVRDNADGRRRRRIYVLLAERGTGFELWRAPIDRLSDYAVTAGSLSAEGGPSSAVSCSQHTMRLSVDDTMSVTARLAFDDQAGADEFHRQLVRLATAADDDSTTASARGGQSKKKRNQKNQKGARSISKADISQPCCFSHVTRLERGVSCRGRPGLHIVVASGRQMPLTAGCAGACADSTPPPPSISLRTARHCHSSFKAGYI